VHVSAHRALHVSCPLVSRALRLPVSGSMGCWPPLSVQMTAPFRMPMSGT
jgi:hypothetical protein